MGWRLIGNSCSKGLLGHIIPSYQTCVAMADHYSLIKFHLPAIAFDMLAPLDHLSIKKFKAIGKIVRAKTLLHMATGRPALVKALVLVSDTPI